MNELSTITVKKEAIRDKKDSIELSFLSLIASLKVFIAITLIIIVISCWILDVGY